jgi:3-isopropylmalate dehydrogenase
VAAGANLNPNPGGVSMFEPIGGTAPDHTGRGTINPLAAIAAAGMMLDALGRPEAARRVDAGIRAVAPKLRSMRAGEMGFSTPEVGDMVAEAAANG